jgi:hypothetical protein
MDPYLEAPDIWPDFHDRLAEVASALLNEQLPDPYYARLEMRPEVGIVEEGGSSRRIVPDLAVARRPVSDPTVGGVGLLASPRTSVSESIEFVVQSEPIRHPFVEIRDPTRGHHLVTLMEIASPSNKLLGPDRQSYLKKQQEVLQSDANLIEIDLLRSGDRLVHAELEAYLSQLNPEPNYVVVVNRAWTRSKGASQLFPILITTSLPCIPIPLREKDPEITLDLQYVMNQVYDRGPYRKVLDYRQPPRPALLKELLDWAQQLTCGVPLR